MNDDMYTGSDDSEDLDQYEDGYVAGQKSAWRDVVYRGLRELGINANNIERVVARLEDSHNSMEIVLRAYWDEAVDGPYPRGVHLPDVLERFCANRQPAAAPRWTPISIPPELGGDYLVTWEGEFGRYVSPATWIEGGWKVFCREFEELDTDGMVSYTTLPEPDEQTGRE